MNNYLLDSNFQADQIKKTYDQFLDYWKSNKFEEKLSKKFKQLEIDPNDLISYFLEEDPNPIKIYLTHLAINIKYISDLINCDEDEELFEFWENSEFASLFLDELEQFNSNITKTSKITLEKLRDHFVSYTCLNFEEEVNREIIVKPLPEIGDYNNVLYVEGKAALLEINGKDFEDKNGFLKIDLIKEEVKELENEVLTVAKNFSLALRPGSVKGIEKLPLFKEKIERCLNALDALAPSLAKTLANFTHTVIALNEPGMVSFSLQSLPGYSSINLFERDLVDCIDDLLHENGHHYLNTILNNSELIVEEPDKAYFSPWRMTQRPLRGIYHGVFTFYWALELFGQLSTNDKLHEHFSSPEIEKIQFRYVEEFYKLTYCENLLDVAYENKLITDAGKKLIKDVLIFVKSHEEKIIEVISNSSEENLKKILSLKEALKS